ncbi:hypothetical protein F3Y22_tig00008146pilonHSYRG00067 [Hibiscus syriacus]|uniref:Protein FAR1-RELATED SEQUENCE n=1 Tax=Hibiscus syriacus TaxID=106335 RepID=A0A6A3CDE3_HIBSY|nr:hypothetical protein F3Y22_tig00008146pilonHSYRG00067 [Hibiscus syriacus]
MMNKSPISVVTDGDRAMQRAIKSVIPYAKHRLCSWHLSRNAQANIGDPKFTAAFSKCMASWWTTEEFDIQWRSITKLFDLESHTAAIFTRESFRTFQDELLRGTLYRIEAEIQSLSDECQHYILSKYKEKNRKFEISFDYSTKTLICSCKKFKTVGLLCYHQLHVLKHLDYTYFPRTLIQSRWTNDAKASAPNYDDLNVSPEVMQMARFAALLSTSSRLYYIASKIDESFKTARDAMKRLIEELENSFGLNDSVNQSIVVNNVRDPQRKQRKRKEVPKNKVEKIIRRCGYCNGERHNKLTCPQVKLSLSIM